MATIINRSAFVWLFFISAAAMAADNAELAKKVEAVLPPHVGACVLAIDHGKVVLEHCSGVADIDTKTPCTPETNFRLASCSKQFTATAVLLLVDRGKLSLDDKLTRFFPGLPKYCDKITVKQLLDHTSGLPDYEGMIPEETTLQLDDYDVLHLLMDTKEPLFVPGEKFAYSNSGYAILGLIVEQVAQQPLHDFMANEMFKPLGMNESVMYQRGLNSVSNRAYGHQMLDGKWVSKDQSLTSAVRGDGGVYSSLRDYRRWLQGIDDQKLLSAASYTAMFTPQVETDRNGSKYGYGWFIDTYRGEPRIHHGGETVGFRHCVQRFPKRGAAIFVQLNSADPAAQLKLVKLGEEVADLAIFGEDSK